MVLIFSKIFAFSDVLFDVLQNKSLDIDYCILKINETKEELQKLRSQFSIFFDETKNLMGPPSQKRRFTNQNDPEEPFRQLFNEIFDTILMQFEIRFQSMNDLMFVKLLNSEKFTEYASKFPVDGIHSLQSSYGSLFDIVTLNNELTVIYSSASFKGLSITNLLKKIMSDGLGSTLPEVVKLANLILTIPASSASPERSFSILKRIKNFLRNSMEQTRLSSLAIISIEKKMLNDRH